MNSKERLLAAFDRKKTDYLPVTSHHLMPYFLKKYMNNMSRVEFFNLTGMDPIHWDIPVMPDPARKEYFAPNQGELDFLQIYKIFSDDWRIETEKINHSDFDTRRDTIITPKGNLTAIIQGNEYTEWVAEYPLKNKQDIELLGEFQPYPICDVDSVNRQVQEIGDWGIMRGFIIPNDLYGQPGCWQDFCCMRGTEQAIMDTYDDPEWVHEALKIIQARKLHYAKSLKGSKYDITELGGGDASTTIISPKIFEEFVAPYDEPIIRAAQDIGGIRVSYHTCGGMMPILEMIADMRPVAMETFTPPELGGDTNLAEAKRRIGGRVCMIGGFDQGNYFINCSPEETRRKVRECFEAAGEGGGYIIAPSDHFFDADPELILAFVDEAQKCTY
ncbi:MAG: uroporphyrinogen decarboxylase family protein [Sphaerochaetaceae bacterium]